MGHYKSLFFNMSTSSRVTSSSIFLLRWVLCPRLSCDDTGTSPNLRLNNQSTQNEKEKSSFASLVIYFFLNYFKTSENLSSYVVFQFQAVFLLPKEDAVLSQN